MEKRIKKTVLGKLLLGLAVAALICDQASAQTLQSTLENSPEPAAVPRLVKFSSSVKDMNGKPLTRVAGVTFALYKDEQGGAPLWLETQNIQPDSSGRYSAMLGSTKSDGLPVNLFSSGEARWLGVQPEGQAEQPRVLLLSVPYALKAADAETVGGLPASAFMRASPKANDPTSRSQADSPFTLPTVHGNGTLNFLPIWTGRTTIGNSVLFQSGSNLGIGTTSPATALDVNGNATIRGNQSVIGNLTAAGFLAGQTGSFSGNSSSAVLNLTQNGSGPGLAAATASASGSTGAVNGTATSTTGKGRGVIGSSFSSSGGVGVLGSAGSFGTSGDAVGVEGISLNIGSGVGVSGGEVIGVEGISSLSSGAGVSGIHTAEGYGGAFINNSSTGWPALAVFSDETSNSGFPILQTLSSFFGSCIIDMAGNLYCTGSKSAVVPVDSGSRKVALYAVESPENWFEDFGSGKLADGVATVVLDATFAQTVNTGTEYHVFLTPNGDCKGLYITQRVVSSFQVRELGGGQSDVEFDYRIVARRKGYENIRLADQTKQFEPSAVPKRAPAQLKRPSRPVVPPVAPRSVDLPIGAPTVR